MEEMYRFAQCALNSGMAPKTFGSPEAILIAVQHGLELGMKPAQALQSIAVINGRPSVYGDAALALVKAHREFEDLIESMDGEGDNRVAKCVALRKGKAPVERTFSVEDAKRAKLWTKAGPWTEYPRRMLAMRARSWAMRDAFPDALKGVGIAEEVRDTETKQANARVIPEPILPDEQTVRLDDPAAAVPDSVTAELAL